ncbi:MAG: hypothetical protein ACKOI1_03385 [Bacteroidota bacterium]
MIFGAEIEGAGRFPELGALEPEDLPESLKERFLLGAGAGSLFNPESHER